MHRISPSQLRAARGLLNWSRADLSKYSGISAPTIARFESGINEPETKTTRALWDIFDKHRVIFSEHQGVRFKSDEVDVYDGIERFNDFYDFLYDHLNTFGGNVCVYTYNESLFPRFRKDPSLHMRRMKALYAQKKITFRILTTISDFKSRGYGEFRWLPNQPPTPTGFYAFGNCLALISFADMTAPHIVVIQSAPLAEGYRQGFNIAWRLGREPPPADVIHKLKEQALLFEKDAEADPMQP
ncbi:MAG: helix-turn-helix transcriptional regulator [Alphaproteobacteria bacterium]|nr:helix-turn-helix transcriptional regulator [Alphaproteobacteria bacterium]